MHADKQGCTQMVRSRGWRLHVSQSQCNLNLRSSLLIRLHLRFPFLLPEQPWVNAVPRGWSAGEATRAECSVFESRTQQSRPLMMIANHDQVCVVVWLRPWAALW